MKSKTTTATAATPQTPLKQPVRTATKKNSIWNPIPESAFRRGVVALARQSRGVPIDPSPSAFSPTGKATDNCTSPSHSAGGGASQSQHLLSLELEYRLASDFAFLAATEEGVKTVAAAYLEEDVERRTLTLRLAANEGVLSSVQRGLEEIWESAVKSAEGHEIQVAREQIFDSILRLCGDRVLARIRLAGGKPPGFARSQQPGRPAGTALARMKQEATSLAGRELVEKLQSLIPEFIEIIHRSESSPTQIDMDSLKDLIKRCYNSTTDDGKTIFKDVLQFSGFNSDTWLNNKEIMQIEKIGAYWRIAREFAKECRRDTLWNQLQKLDVQAVSPFEPVSSSISLDNRPVFCFVHAEVQLIIHYLLRGHGSRTQPRVIGASKSVCFLCGLFIKSHGKFRAPAGHGRLFDHWTIPDLAEFDQSQLRLMRKVVQEMHKTISSLLKVPKIWRPYPLTSRQDLIELPLSSADASSSSTIRAMPQGQAINSVAQIGEDSCESRPTVLETLSEVQERPSLTQVNRISSEQSGPGMTEEANTANASASSITEASKRSWKTVSDTPRCIESWRESNLNILVEVERPSKAQYRLMPRSHSPDSSSMVIQLQDLVVDQEVSLERRPSENAVKLCFRDANAIRVGVELEWTLVPS